jgi:signal transduction histidine kinase
MTDHASARGLTIGCTVDPDLPSVSVDRQRINHVFANLITNGIKHSPAGGRIRLRATKSDEHTIEFSVSDEGPGVAPEYHARIFDRFFRVPGQGKTGAGLGLSIAREIAVAHGGRIRVRSSPGQGATFYVALKAVSEEAVSQVQPGGHASNA